MTTNATTAFNALAVTSSVPFRVSMTGRDLATIFETGTVPAEFWPHVHRALTEAPIEMIERIVAKFDPHGGMISRLRSIAAQVDASERIEMWLRG